MQCIEFRTRGSVEIDGGLVGFLTTVPFGGAARGAVDQRVSLFGCQPGRVVHVQRVKIAHAVIRSGRPPRVTYWIVHLVYSHLVVVFASRRERLRSLQHKRKINKKKK